MNTRTPILLCAALVAASCSSSPATRPSAGVVPAPKAYVGLFGDNAVAVIDTATNRITKTIPVPAGPHGLVVTPDGAKVYISSDGGSTVSVISTDRDAITGSIDVGMTPHGLAISKDGKRIACAGFGTDTLQVIDTGQDVVVARIAIARPHNGVITPDGRHAYVGSQQAGAPAIVVVDLDAGTVTATVPLQHAPRALDVGQDGRIFFTQAGVDGLGVLDPATNQIAAAPIATGGSPHHMISDGPEELVVSQTAGDLEVVDVAKGSVEGHIATGKAPHWIALSSDRSRAYVTNESDNSVSAIALATRSIVATIAVGNGPRKIAVQPAVTAAAPTMVEIRAKDDFSFAPRTVTVPAGTVVRWANPGAIPHTVTSGASSRAADSPGALFDGALRSGATFERRFDTPGEFPYFCRFHEGMGMAGVVTVTGHAGGK
jgi:YVTN family beta-propeller protein